MAKQLGEKVKIKINGIEGKTVTFTKDSCSSSKEAATKQAVKVRETTGKTARVLEDKALGKFCVYTGPKAKPRGKK